MQEENCPLITSSEAGDGFVRTGLREVARTGRGQPGDQERHGPGISLWPVVPIPRHWLPCSGA